MTKTSNYLKILAALMALAMLSTMALAVHPADAVKAAPAKTTLTIKAEGVDLSGTIKSSTRSCLGDRNVSVYKQVGKKQNPNVDRKIAMDTSERQGNIGVWSTGNTGMSGKFYARTGKASSCTAAVSDTIVARRN